MRRVIRRLERQLVLGLFALLVGNPVLFPQPFSQVDHPAVRATKWVACIFSPRPSFLFANWAERLARHGNLYSIPRCKMKAARIVGKGGPEVLKLQEVEAPRVGRGEVAVRVRATAVNRADLL